MVYKIKSYAKINLALNITWKKKVLHKIESIISFIDLHDVILINPYKGNKHHISFCGKFSKNIGKKNTVEKLFQYLDKQNLLNNKKFKIRIKKIIPQQAGLGGGSMNAASILNFLIKKKIINPNTKEIRSICNSIGSDVILGTISSSCVLSSNDKINKIYDTPKYYSILVKPDFGCSTKKIYSAVRKYTNPIYNKPKKYMFGSKYLIDQKNALETIALKKYPKLKKIKLFLENINNPLFVRMTGSGSTIVSYYNSLKSCRLAKAKIKRKYKNYWCVTAKTIWILYFYVIGS